MAPGKSATITATVANLGDTVANEIPVAFYDSDPAKGGTLIGKAATTGTLLSGSSQDVQIL